MSNSANQIDESQLHILLVEDSIPFAKLVIGQLCGALATKPNIQHVDRIHTAFAAVREKLPNLIILDLHLPDCMGLDTFYKMQQAAPDVPIVILSSNDCEEIAISAVQQGAQDYLIKSEDSRLKLVRSLRFAVERRKRLVAEQELSVARKIQQSLLPKRGPVLKGFDIAGDMFPAVETSGDYYDFIFPMPALGDNIAGFAVGDVSGHGLGPAMVMAETRACVVSLAMCKTNLAHILEKTNQVILRGQSDLFVTILLGYIEPTNHSFIYSSAGHPGYRLSQSDEVTVLDATGMPLGVQDHATYEMAPPLPLHQGDILLLVTDGLYEAHSASLEMFTVERVLDFVRQNRHKSAKMIVQELYETVREFATGKPQEDDITAVIIKVE